ncbi:hypothetical protein ACFODL_17160 [Phenylobacterium terrae]|uniref:Uncharacterized protein n=1 Tax=Phenylobacterium terrae TaxID=2665495 RepID=A0ABW4N2Q7_9CAUL
MQTAPLDPAARSADRLEPGERLLIAALQAWLSDGSATSLRTLGKVMAWRTSPRVAALFLGWVHAMDAARLRPIEATCRHCGGASQDVQRLVVACGLAPVDLDLGERLIAPLVSEATSVMVLARALNAALAQAGWPLPARLGVQDPSHEQPTMH